MTTHNPAQLMTEVIDKIQTIDHFTVRLTGGARFFNSFPSLRLPKFGHSELGMLRSVSWLYAMYQELSKPNVDFVRERFDLYLVDTEGKSKNYLDNVNNLRTFFQHNLDPMSPSDVKTHQACERWFKEKCGSSYPEEDEEWLSCLVEFLVETRAYLRVIMRCLQAIDSDESRMEILRQWEFRRSRFHPQHEFDRIIEVVASDLGRDSIKPKNFSNRYYYANVTLHERSKKHDNRRDAQRRVRYIILQTGHPVGCPYGANHRTGF